MSLHAVITADIVNSTKLSPEEASQLIARLKDILKPFQFAFYRGDSFQLYMEDPGTALGMAMLCRTLAIGFDPDQERKITDVRMGIGIGEVNPPVRYPESANGEAFLLSGRVFDEQGKTGARLSICSPDQLANAGLAVIAAYADAICRDMTAKQAAVIFELLQGHSQQETAARLKKSRSTINQHVSAGSWPELENLIRQYRHLITLLKG